MCFVWLLLLHFLLGCRSGNGERSVAIGNGIYSAAEMEFSELKQETFKLELLLKERIQRDIVLKSLIEETENEINFKLEDLASLQDMLRSIQEIHAEAVKSVVDAHETQVNQLKEAIRLLNQNIIYLELQAQKVGQDAQNKLLECDKLKYMITEQWMYVQQLEQALHIAEVNSFEG